MSTVIKVGEVGRLAKRLSTVDLADHLAEARAVIEEARRRAAQIVGRAQQESDRTLTEAHRVAAEQGHREGFEAGTRDGRQAAREEALQRFQEEQVHIVADLRRIVDEFDALKTDIHIAATRDLLDFAVRLATKLTFAVGRLHHESAVENLKRALALVESKTDLTVRAHPSDIASLELFAKSTMARVQASPATQFLADETIAPGGCKLLSERSDVDATLETQVEEIVSLLLGEEATDG